MEEPLVCAIVVTYNGSRLIGRMLESLQRTEYGNLRVVVVDNGSSDGSGGLVRKGFPQVKLLELTPNRGFSGASNIATGYALKEYGPAYIVWLNDDMEIVDPLWLRTLVSTAQRTKAGITGCKLVFPDGRIQYAGGFFHPLRITVHRGVLEQDRGQYDDELDVDYVNGACFMISAEAIRKIGLLDEGYSPIYFEEADYCARARKAGFRVVYTGRTKIVHYTSATVKKDDAGTRYYAWEKNRMRFMMRNFPVYWMPLGFGRVLAGAFVSSEGGKAAPANPISRLPALAKAFGDALGTLKQRGTELKKGGGQEGGTLGTMEPPAPSPPEAPLPRAEHGTRRKGGGAEGTEGGAA